MDSGTSTESPSPATSQPYPASSLLLSSPSMPSLGLASPLQSTQSLASPTQSSSVSSSSLSNSQSPTGEAANQSSSPSPMYPTSSFLSTYKNMMHSAKGTWAHDPLHSPDWDSAGPPGILCSHRVKKDLTSIFSDPLPGIFIVPEDECLFRVHCLIIGPFDTPYEGGFFHFVIRFGPQYPLHPPRVRLMTTGGGSVRFNPNLYKNGKVCLSILGTWSGPAWSPASNLSSVVLSLQSLMNEHPYHNEPGHEKERRPGDSELYNTIIMHETIRISVLQQLMTIASAPEELVKVMHASFMEYYDHYVEICQKNIHKDGQQMMDPFGEERGMFQYGTMLKQLKRLKENLEAKGIPVLPETSSTVENGQSAEAAGGGGDDASSISLSEENDGALGSDDDGEEEEEEDNDQTTEGGIVEGLVVEN